MMSLFATVSFVTGMVFVSLGAWPVMGFFGLDVLLFYVAFKWNYRDGTAFEKIDIEAEHLVIERNLPGHPKRLWRFPTYWVRVDLKEDGEESNILSVRSHGKSLCVGEFLSPQERIEFAAALRKALVVHQA